MRKIIHSVSITLLTLVMSLTAAYAQNNYSETIPMVYVQGGIFQMSSNDSSVGFGSNPVHNVRLDGYYIGKYEVTQKIWKDIMGRNPSHTISEGNPVEDVTWMDCILFCNALSRKMGLKECYIINGDKITLDINRNGYRLPTEAEWEFAARGGSKSQGYKYSGSNNINDVAWYDGNSNNRTHSVGILRSNELGIYDMSGNVQEWCWDWRDNYDIDEQSNPVGVSSGSHKICRGGSYFNSEKGCSSVYRNSFPPDMSFYYLGLRLVRRP